MLLSPFLFTIVLLSAPGPSFNFASYQATGNDPYHTLVSWLQRPRQAMKARSGARHSSCPSKTDCWSSKVPAISTCAYETWLIDICVYVALLNCECIGIYKLQAHSNMWHGSFISVVSPCDLCMCVLVLFSLRAITCIQYGVATVSMIDEITGLFCRISSLL